LGKMGETEGRKRQQKQKEKREDIFEKRRLERKRSPGVYTEGGDRKKGGGQTRIKRNDPTTGSFDHGGNEEPWKMKSIFHTLFTGHARVFREKTHMPQCPQERTKKIKKKKSHARGVRGLGKKAFSKHRPC